MKNAFHHFRRFLAKLWLDINLQLTVVGVTGSYGKTSATSAIAAVLKEKYSVNRTDLNLDTIYNLPITILKTKIWNEVLVLEYGVDHIGEMDKHLSLVKPQIAVLTGITPVHADKEHFGSLENIIREKRKLINALPEDGLAVFNYDDEIVRKIGRDYDGRKMFYGTKKEADIWASDIKITTEGTFFRINWENKENKEAGVETWLLGYPAVYSCLVAWAVGKELKIEENKILESLKKLKPLKGRFSIEPGPMGTILVNDALRANFVSTLSGLKSLAEFSGRKVAVLGEMGEIGATEEEIHRQIGQKIAGLKIDCLVGVGPLAKFIVEEARKNGLKEAYWREDVFEAAELLAKILKKDDYFYLKASLMRHLERIVFLLEKKQVGCRKTVCHNYNNCSTCSKLSKKI